jgi:signal transduction histidine kinase
MIRALRNLVTNAIEAMPRGGTLRIAGRNFDSKLEISVSDTGPGITREVLENIWNPLHTTKAKGIGLGLSIAKRIVEAHGGCLSVETTLGKGSTFTVAIPIERVLGRKGVKKK